MKRLINSIYNDLINDKVNCYNYKLILKVNTKDNNKIYDYRIIRKTNKQLLKDNNSLYIVSLTNNITPKDFKRYLTLRINNIKKNEYPIFTKCTYSYAEFAIGKWIDNGVTYLDFNNHYYNWEKHNHKSHINDIAKYWKQKAYYYIAKDNIKGAEIRVN